MNKREENLSFLVLIFFVLLFLAFILFRPVSEEPSGLATFNWDQGVVGSSNIIGSEILQDKTTMGVAIGVIAFVLLLIGTLITMKKRKKKQKEPKIEEPKDPSKQVSSPEENLPADTDDNKKALGLSEKEIEDLFKTEDIEELPKGPAEKLAAAEKIKMTEKKPPLEPKRLKEKLKHVGGKLDFGDLPDAPPEKEQESVAKKEKIPHKEPHRPKKEEIPKTPVKKTIAEIKRIILNLLRKGHTIKKIGELLTKQGISAKQINSVIDMINSENLTKYLTYCKSKKISINSVMKLLSSRGWEYEKINKVRKRLKY